MTVGVVDWWQQRGARRRARAEGRHLIREARRILKRKRFRIPEAVADVVKVAVGNLESALDTSNVDGVRVALTALDEVMEDKLAFARKSTIREYSESIGIAVAIALLLRAFVVEAFQIPSGSMIPTLEVGDHIFVAKFSYGLGIPFTNTKVFEVALPKRGDVIVFKFPLDPSTDYIKRVVGLPGDRIELRQNELFINGRPVPREHVGAYRYSESGRGSPMNASVICGTRRWTATVTTRSRRWVVRRRVTRRSPCPRETCSSWETTATTRRIRACGERSSTI